MPRVRKGCPEGLSGRVTRIRFLQCAFSVEDVTYPEGSAEYVFLQWAFWVGDATCPEELSRRVVRNGHQNTFFLQWAFSVGDATCPEGLSGRVFWKGNQNTFPSMGFLC